MNNREFRLEGYILFGENPLPFSLSPTITKQRRVCFILFIYFSISASSLFVDGQRRPSSLARTKHLRPSLQRETLRETLFSSTTTSSSLLFFFLVPLLSRITTPRRDTSSSLHRHFSSTGQRVQAGKRRSHRDDGSDPAPREPRARHHDRGHDLHEGECGGPGAGARVPGGGDARQA